MNKTKKYLSFSFTIIMLMNPFHLLSSFLSPCPHAVFQISTWLDNVVSYLVKRKEEKTDGKTITGIWLIKFNVDENLFTYLFVTWLINDYNVLLALLAHRNCSIKLLYGNCFVLSSIIIQHRMGIPPSF